METKLSKAVSSNLLREDAQDTLRARITALRNVIEFGNTKDRETINNIINDMQKDLEYLMSKKEFIYNFKGGGWNTALGRDKHEAYLSAKHKHGKFEPILETFKLNY